MSQAALAQDPDSPDALVMLGDIERHEGRAPRGDRRIRACGGARRRRRARAGMGAAPCRASARTWAARARTSRRRSRSTAREADVPCRSGDGRELRQRSRPGEERARTRRSSCNPTTTWRSPAWASSSSRPATSTRRSWRCRRRARSSRAMRAPTSTSRPRTTSSARTTAALFELSRATESIPTIRCRYLLASLIRLDRIEPVAAVEQAQEALKRIPYLKSLNQVADNQKGVANVGTPLAFMGLEYWARSAAHESYLPFWGASHLFLADRYAGDFDKRSELMQGFVTDPLVVRRIQPVPVAHHAAREFRHGVAALQPQQRPAPRRARDHGERQRQRATSRSPISARPWTR